MWVECTPLLVRKTAKKRLVSITIDLRFMYETYRLHSTLPLRVPNVLKRHESDVELDMQ